jgi:hypothetical protein
MFRSNAAWSIVAVTPKPPGGKVNVDDIEVRIDPRRNGQIQRSGASIAISFMRRT